MLRSLQKPITLIFVLVFSCAVGQVSAKELFLASEGNTAYSIVNSKDASATERFAASELQGYLQVITEANFVSANRLVEKSIVVCNKDSLKNIARDISLPELSPEGYCIVQRQGSLYLIGNDDRGLLYAVYDFLHRVGCRWLAPNFHFYKGSAEFIPQKKKLVFNLVTDIVEKPALKYRKLYIEEGRSHNTENLLQMIQWMPKLRFNTLVIPVDVYGEGRVRWDNWREALTGELQKRNITIEVGGHGYQNYLNSNMEAGRLFEMHPEWFGVDDQGNRSKEKRRVFCVSNHDAVAYLHENVLAYLYKHPEIDIFDFWPPDSARWCQCKHCNAYRFAIGEARFSRIKNG